MCSGAAAAAAGHFISCVYVSTCYLPRCPRNRLRPGPRTAVPASAAAAAPALRLWVVAVIALSRSTDCQCVRGDHQCALLLTPRVSQIYAAVTCGMSSAAARGTSSTAWEPRTERTCATAMSTVHCGSLGSGLASSTQPPIAACQPDGMRLALQGLPDAPCSAQPRTSCTSMQASSLGHG